MLLPISILALVYVAFRYPSLQRKQREGSNSRTLIRRLFVYPLGFLFLAAGLLSGTPGLVYLTLIFLAAPAAVRLAVPRGVYVSGFFLAGVAIFLPPMKEAFELRRDALAFQQAYPLESLTERLAYEQRRDEFADRGGARHQNRSVPANAEFIQPLTAPPSADEFVVLKLPTEELIDRSDFIDGAERTYALAVVHNLWWFRFQNLIGNGYVRMGWRRDWRDHLREGVDPEDLYLPDEYTPVEQYVQDVAAANELQGVLSSSDAPERPSAGTHVRSVVDFVRPSGWGYVESREQVAGFKPHRFRNRPVVLDPETQKLAEWRITRLELVSLLKYDTPRVYLTEALPNMETLSGEDVPTRELVRFERRALELLENGNDLVIEERPHDIRMLGSLRAVKDCRRCHEVPADSLLGAFSYELKKPAVGVTVR